MRIDGFYNPIADVPSVLVEAILGHSSKVCYWEETGITNWN